MKKLWLFLLFVGTVSICRGESLKLDVTDILPNTYSANSTTAAASITISSSTADRICITDIDFQASVYAGLSILNGNLSGGTTLWYIINHTTNSIYSFDRSYENAVCGEPSQSVTVYVSHGSSGASKLNVQGYKRRRP